MWKDVDVHQLAREVYLQVQPCTKEEIEEHVRCARLELYNRDLPCGPRPIRERLEERQVHPLPSERAIGKLLARLGLTHGRTGFYR
jgi:hypothetical protein